MVVSMVRRARDSIWTLRCRILGIKDIDVADGIEVLHYLLLRIISLSSLDFPFSSIIWWRTLLRYIISWWFQVVDVYQLWLRSFMCQSLILIIRLYFGVISAVRTVTWLFDSINAWVFKEPILKQKLTLFTITNGSRRFIRWLLSINSGWLQFGPSLPKDRAWLASEFVVCVCEIDTVESFV